MLNRRHHIHLICDSRDASLYHARDALAIFFETQAFLTHDLYSVTADSANYSWRCINACDYVIVLLGESYGELTNTGVSQLHISYLNAKTKHKPIIALVDTTTKKSRQLNDLLTLIRQDVLAIYEFDDSTDMPALMSEAYEKMTTSHIKQGWMSSDVLQASLEERIEERQAELMDTQQQPSQTKDDHNLSGESSQIAPTAYEHNLLGRATSLLTPSLQDDVMLSCTAHAFQGGTLIEVGFMSSVTWQAILSRLVNLSVFSTQTLWRTLNELVTPEAMSAIKFTHPNVHAVSRCQVTKADMLWVQEELIGAGWLAKSARQTGAVTKENWQTTKLAKIALSPAS